MKVSIEGILVSAKKINADRQIGEEGLNRRRGADVKTDSVEIENRLGYRLDLIQRELKDIQTSLTKNQVVRDGVDRLMSDFADGGRNTAAILEEAQFEGKKALRDFVGSGVTPEVLTAKMERINALIAQDVTKLTRLQVEVENILASNLASSDRVGSVMRSIESALEKTDAPALYSLSRLSSDTVIRLIK